MKKPKQITGGIGPMLMDAGNILNIAKALCVRSNNYDKAARKASNRGDLIETIINSAKAGILNDIAEEFEHEAAR